MLLVSVQHVLLMYGGAVAVPLIVGQAAGLSREEIAVLINADLLVAGIATVVQSMGIGPVGIRMPPAAVLGGAGIAMFGMVAATGIKILQEADIGDRRNQLLVAVSIGLGMVPVPVVGPEFFAHLPHWMEPIIQSGIAVATLSAVTLNLLFNVLGGPERHALTGAAHH